ncbi:MAG TPA: 16S rRNA (cytosine(1402)-N(4))-methyltransferase RsmH [Caulobacteraceae bacterium]|nr:16S rRNA (cytosine(1402)-N(4))-methyltransferase RsmH [Caulobacteraceae bacterium]
MSARAHAPVMLAEVVEALAPAPGKTIIDGTFGGGGYARAFLAAGAAVVAFDKDPQARRRAAALTQDPNFRFVAASFTAMRAEVGESAAQGVALDLGISSMQLDDPQRGFSFQREGPLDMRMGGEGQSAADLVNSLPEAELARLLRDLGEEPRSRRIAAAIARRRAERPFLTTLDLAQIVEHAVGGRRGAKIHPATRVFQALRIAVNDELGELERGLGAAEGALAVGGALAVVSFHSLEDRIVKTFLVERSGGKGVSRHLPPAAAVPAPSFSLLFAGARRPGAEELAANPRARSARLRAARRTAAPAFARKAA